MFPGKFRALAQVGVDMSMYGNPVAARGGLRFYGSRQPGRGGSWADASVLSATSADGWISAIANRTTRDPAGHIDHGVVAQQDRQIGLSVVH